VGGLFFQRKGSTIAVEFHHAISLGIFYRIGKDSGSFRLACRIQEHPLQALTVKQVVAQH
jgi:hypothetical protein